MSISEVVGMEGDIVTMQDIFVFERGIGEKGKVLVDSDQLNSSKFSGGKYPVFISLQACLTM